MADIFLSYAREDTLDRPTSRGRSVSRCVDEGATAATKQRGGGAPGGGRVPSPLRSGFYAFYAAGRVIRALVCRPAVIHRAAVDFDTPQMRGRRARTRQELRPSPAPCEVFRGACPALWRAGARP